MAREILLAPAHRPPQRARRLADQLLSIHDEPQLVDLLKQLTQLLRSKAKASVAPAPRLEGEREEEARHRLEQLDRIRTDRLFLLQRLSQLQIALCVGEHLAPIQQEAAAIARRDREHDALTEALNKLPPLKMKA